MTEADYIRDWLAVSEEVRGSIQAELLFGAGRHWLAAAETDKKGNEAALRHIREKAKAYDAAAGILRSLSEGEGSVETLGGEG